MRIDDKSHVRDPRFPTAVDSLRRWAMRPCARYGAAGPRNRFGFYGTFRDDPGRVPPTPDPVFSTESTGISGTCALAWRATGRGFESRGGRL